MSKDKAFKKLNKSEVTAKNFFLYAQRGHIFKYSQPKGEERVYLVDDKGNYIKKEFFGSTQCFDFLTRFLKHKNGVEITLNPTKK